MMSGDLIVIVVVIIMLIVVGCIVDIKDREKEEEERAKERASAKEQLQKEIDKPEIVRLRLYLKDGTSVLGKEINPILQENSFSGSSVYTREESARYLIKKSMERGYFEIDDNGVGFVPMQSIRFVKIEKLSK
jgi:hypothetical protein